MRVTLLAILATGAIGLVGAGAFLFSDPAVAQAQAPGRTALQRMFSFPGARKYSLIECTQQQYQNLQTYCSGRCSFEHHDPQCKSEACGQCYNKCYSDGAETCN
jgi:hypothetical protein